MAFNPDTSLKNRHRLVLGASGAGKSQLIRELVPAKGIRLLGWDTDEDHEGHHFDHWPTYAREVAKAVKSGRPFRLLWAGDNGLKTFEKWCALVFVALDGRTATEILIEELADVSKSSGTASPNFGQLIRRARKYNGGLTMASQRGTEISKTVYTQANEFWIGRQETTDLPRMAKLAAVSEARMGAIKPLEYIRKVGPDITFHRLTFTGNKRKLTELTERR